MESVREEAGEAVGAGVGEAGVEAEVGCSMEPLQAGGAPDPGEARVVGLLELNPVESVREGAGEAVGAGVGEAAVEAEVDCLWDGVAVSPCFENASGYGTVEKFDDGSSAS